jgi:hypothetical protein
MVYFFLRYGIIPVLLLLWVGHQMVFKNKSYLEIKPDLFAALFLTAVYLVFTYLIFR